jgi:predicted transcriptional regulator
MAKPANKSVTITARISPALSKRLARFAKLTGHTKSYAVERLIREHIDYETWFIREVRKGIESANRGELIPHEEAMRRIRDHIAARKREKRKAA